MALTTGQVVVTFVSSSTSPKYRKVTNSGTQEDLWGGARGCRNVGEKIIIQITTHTDNQLPTPLLRNPEHPRILNLAMNPVTATIRLVPQPARLVLDKREVFATGSSSDARDVLHNEY